MDLLKAKQIKTIMQQHDSANAFSASSSDEEVDEDQAALNRRHKQEATRRESTASEERWANAVAVNLGPSIWGPGSPSRPHHLAADRGRASRSASFSVGQEINPGMNMMPVEAPPAVYDTTRLLREQFQQMKFKNRSKSSYAAAWHVPDFDEDDGSEDAIYDDGEGVEGQAAMRRRRQSMATPGQAVGEPPGLRYTTPTNPRLDDLRGERRRASFNSAVSLSSGDADVTSPRLGMFATSQVSERRESFTTTSPPIGPGTGYGQNAANYGSLMADVDRYFSSDDHRLRPHGVSSQVLHSQHPSFQQQQPTTRQFQQQYPQHGAPHSSVSPTIPGPLYLVEFKACRTDVFYLPENSGIEVHVGDLVLVEADRGRDLGKVTHENVTLAQVRQLKQRQAREQALALGAQPEEAEKAQQQAAALASGGGLAMLQPKLIYRLAQAGEVAQLLVKSQDEQQAMLVCQAKVRQRKLPMEVLDGEYQWDRRKLTFFYIASQRIDFRDLVRDLFKIYKTRIWMCAVNPEAVTQHAPGTKGPVPAQVRAKSPKGLDATAAAYNYSQMHALQQSHQQAFQQHYGVYAPQGMSPGYMLQDPYSGYSHAQVQMPSGPPATMHFGEHSATMYRQSNTTRQPASQGQ